MLSTYHAWRSALPTAKHPKIAPVLASRRFRLLQSSGRDFLVVDFLWGAFLEGILLADAVAALGVFLEKVPTLCDRARTADARVTVTIICVGGPPPLAFVRAASGIFAERYPGLLGTVLIYPSPPWLSTLVGAVGSLLPSSLRPSFRLASTEAELMQLSGLDELPDELQLSAAAGRLKGETSMDTSIWASRALMTLLLAYADIGVGAPEHGQAPEHAQDDAEELISQVLV
jgi:hypothetical protein